MKFGHLPAGYIASKLLFEKFNPRNISYNVFLFCGLAGSIAPDMDMFYKYATDDFNTSHRLYVSHLPLVWLALLLFSAVWLSISNKKDKKPVLAVMFFFNGLIHLVFDTFTGEVFWLAPFNSSFSVILSDVSNNNNSLDWNYFVQWPFVLELIVIWWAIYLHFRKYFRQDVYARRCSRDKT